MGIDNANFVKNAGSASLVLIIFLLHTFVIPLVKILRKRGWNGPGSILKKIDMDYDNIIGMWIRLWHEQLITFI